VSLLRHSPPAPVGHRDEKKKADMQALILSPGDKLSNGATVLAHAGETVLALWGREFVTWRINVHGETFLGHYHSTVSDAVADFNERSH
jgi:hypothetical protein